jgi:hypothetical protein
LVKLPVAFSGGSTLKWLRSPAQARQHRYSASYLCLGETGVSTLDDLVENGIVLHIHHSE